MFRLGNAQNGQTLIFLIVLILIVGSAMLGGGFNNAALRPKEKPTPTPGGPNYIPIEPTTAGKLSNLQLRTIVFTTITPVPSSPPPQDVPPPNCTPDSYAPNAISNPNSSNSSGAQSCGIGSSEVIATGINTTTGQCCVEDGSADSASSCCPGVQNFSYMACALNVPVWCDAKPVIYLYPTVATKVNVKVTIPGKITLSIPDYKNGWNIEANPDGSFISDGKNYKELFYETAQEKTSPPNTGIIVMKKDLKPTLTEITTKLGLNSLEQNEFLDYWLPRLNGVKHNYVLVSYFSASQKEDVDHVVITPKPDTFINFIMYFKGVDQPFELSPIKLPPSPPERIGFTAVEWGGILAE